MSRETVINDESQDHTSANSDDLGAHRSPFEAIRHVDESGREFWYARDIGRLLDYSQWQKFKAVIEKARIACVKSQQQPEDHFISTDEMVPIGSGARRSLPSFKLSRYACYLIIQNADPNKEIVALGQTYFVVQVRRQEQADELAGLTENQKRIYLRYQLADHNKQLATFTRRRRPGKAGFQPATLPI